MATTAEALRSDGHGHGDGSFQRTDGERMDRALALEGDHGSGAMHEGEPVLVAVVHDADEDREITAGLDALELEGGVRRPWGRRLATRVLPMLSGVLLVGVVWQVLFLLKIWPDYNFPSPADSWASFTDQWSQGNIVSAATTSLSRGATGYLLSVLVGTPVGLLIARVRFLRLAFGSIISSLQSLPSVAWVPFGIVLFGLTPTTIYFVVIMGAFPSIVGGMVSAVDQTPPLLFKVGRALGASGFAFYRHIVLPAALPGYIAGLKQAWSFSWRSLMAAELITSSPDLGLGLGQLLDNARTTADRPMVVMAILLILVVGLIIDQLVFAPLDNAVRRRRGLSGHI